MRKEPGCRWTTASYASTKYTFPQTTDAQQVLMSRTWKLAWAERGSWHGHEDKGGAGPQAVEHGDKGDPERAESKGRAKAWGPGMGQ